MVRSHLDFTYVSYSLPLTPAATVLGKIKIFISGKKMIDLPYSPF